MTSLLLFLLAVFLVFNNLDEYRISIMSIVMNSLDLIRLRSR